MFGHFGAPKIALPQAARLATAGEPFVLTLLAKGLALVP